MFSEDAKKWHEAVLGGGMAEKVAKAKVLVIGAGGIGCELLKTLVLQGFRSIRVVDLDTIETSNLNRQFLFRAADVGRSKAETACAAVRHLRRDAEVVGTRANIKDATFDVDFFRSFDIVLNGLDNLEARRHVNRMTLAAGTPSVESGTSGYLGQVSSHIRGTTECFECLPKPIPKTYPVCTIRNTPDKPIHCTVWAKELLFARLFGPPDQATDLDDAGVTGGGDQGGEGGEQGRGAAGGAADGETAGLGDAGGAADGETAGPSVASTPTSSGAGGKGNLLLRGEGEGDAAYAARIFRLVFEQDVARLAANEEVWSGGKTKPRPLVLEEVFGSDASAAEATAGRATASEGGPPADPNPSLAASAALGLSDPSVTWSVREDAAVFLESTARLLRRQRMEAGGRERPPEGEVSGAPSSEAPRDPLSFDKDDTLAVDFVTAASNLRSRCYGIPTQSLFACKGMAGNIIHAIATTNAIVSGLIVLEALKILGGAVSQTRTTYLQQYESGGRLLTPVQSPEPNPGCLACGVATLTLTVPTATMTLGGLVDRVLKGRLGLVEPSIVASAFMYEEGDDLREEDPDEWARSQAYRRLPLSQLPGGGIGGGSVLEVTDQAQDVSFRLTIVDRESWDEEKDPDGFVIQGGGVAGVAADAAPRAADEAAAAETDAGRGSDVEVAEPREPAGGEAPDGSAPADEVSLLGDGDAAAARPGAPAAPASPPDGEGKRARAPSELTDGEAKRARVSHELEVSDDDVVVILDD